MFSGAITALVTPMKGTDVDLGKLREFVEWQISEGIDGLVPCGTTGETPTLSSKEVCDVISTVVDQAKKRVPVIAGAGASATRQAIENSKLAKEAGADALLHVTPPYNKPTQAGLVAHYRALAKATDLPIILYNVPGRTGCDLKPETVRELADVETIVAVKEATGSIARAQELIASRPKRFAVLSGDDALTMTMTAAGGDGVISVTSNAAPRLMHDLVAAVRASELERARPIHYKLQRLIGLLFCQSNPIPIKAAVSLLGFTENTLRAPLTSLEGQPFEDLRAEMKAIGLLK